MLCSTQNRYRSSPPPSIIFVEEKRKLLFVPDAEDSDKGEEQAAQDPEPGQNEEANLIVEAAGEEGRGHGTA